MYESTTPIYSHKFCIHTCNIELTQRVEDGNHVQSLTFYIFKQEIFRKKHAIKIFNTSLTNISQNK